MMNLGIFLLAIALVLIICTVTTAVKVEDIKVKIGIFTLITGIATGALLVFAGHEGLHEIKHIFTDEYPKFIGIPAATILIASLSLFVFEIDDDVPIGWFLLVWGPILGNSVTTWAIVPLCVGLVPVLRRRHPQYWVYIIMAVGVFSGNLLATGTLTADPPQALLAIYMAAKGTPLEFFEPLKYFWLYMIFTWVFYALILVRAGVKFGHISNLFKIKPKNPYKFFAGACIALCIAIGLVKPWFHHGYNILYFLGGIVLIGSVYAWRVEKKPGSDHEFHKTLHWGLDTIFIFFPFFTVAGLVVVGLKLVNISGLSLIPTVSLTTMLADNAAAFKIAYGVLQDESMQVIMWYGLFPSITYGGASPVGNGPQIILFLVILPALGHISQWRAFKTWCMEAIAIVPYLLVWSYGVPLLISFGVHGEQLIVAQVLIGVIALSSASAMMSIPAAFRHTLDARGEIKKLPEDDETLNGNSLELEAAADDSNTP